MFVIPHFLQPLVFSYPSPFSRCVYIWIFYFGTGWCFWIVIACLIAIVFVFVIASVWILLKINLTVHGLPSPFVLEFFRVIIDKMDSRSQISAGVRSIPYRMTITEVPAFVVRACSCKMRRKGCTDAYIQDTKYSDPWWISRRIHAHL